MAVKSSVAVAALVWLTTIHSYGRDYLAISAGADFDGPTYMARLLYRHEFSHRFQLWLSRDIRSYMEASVGVWEGGGEYDKHNYSLSLRYVLATRLGSFEHTYMEIGFGPVGITDREMNGFRDLGYHLQFDSHLGITHFFSKELYLSYRVQHISNGNLGDPNPGMNIQTLTIGKAI